MPIRPLIAFSFSTLGLLAACNRPDHAFAIGTDTGESTGAQSSTSAAAEVGSSEGGSSSGEDTDDDEMPNDSGSAGDEPELPAFSPGCGVPLSEAWLSPHTVYWGEAALAGTVEAFGASRRFLIELPEPYDPEHPYPIVFTFHGYGATMDNAYGQRMAEAWDRQVIAVYPQAAGAAWRTNPNSEDFAFFLAMLDAIGSQTCIDMSRVFVQGTSMGGIMANALGCARSDIVDGVGATASMFPLASIECGGAVPAWIMHGRGDQTIPFSSGEQVRDIWLKLNGCSEATASIAGTPCVSYSQCERAPVVWCAHDGAHDQPGAQGLKDDLIAFLRAL